MCFLADVRQHIDGFYEGSCEQKAYAGTETGGMAVCTDDLIVYPIRFM
jgi:hypothetical protein